MQKPLKYNSSDSWLLTAIVYSTGKFKKSCSILDIIMSGDMINKAIFNLEELNNGLSKLIAIGYIKKESDQYKLTKKFKTDKRKYIKRSKNLNAEWNKYEKMLKEVFSNQVEFTYQEMITNSEFLEAYSKYKRTFEKYI